MTHRPGKLRELIKVDLDRPRDVTSAEFNQIKRHVMEVIKEEAQLAREVAV